MKTIRVHEFGGPEGLRVEELPTPQPGPGQVLVKLHAVGVNPVETYIRAGKYSRLPKLPYTPGNDGAGVVEKTGNGVSEFCAGDRIYIAGSISGSYAEYASADAASASITGECFVRARRGDGHAVRDGVSRDDSASGSAAGRNCSHSWRERRCGHGRAATGARAWTARIRHREYG